jgi:Rps23 Pro-64 3,4-dihydroxylase Tpa1-like proline 4-hydroxylase
VVGVKILSEESLEELMNPTFETEKAKVYTQNGNAKTDDSKRNTTRYKIWYNWFPEICKEFEDYINDGTVVRQFDLLLYEAGGKFEKHLDESRNRLTDKRVWSTITLLDKSDNLIGGDLVIYQNGDDEVGQVVNLNVGETIIFDSKTTWHEITEVIQGTRLSLVAWLKSA